MKKKTKIALGIVLALVVAFAGLVIYRFITGPAEDLSLTEEQRKEMLAGEWIDPRGIAEPYIFLADGTGHILGKDITWKLDGGHDEGNGAPYASFYVDYYFSGSQEADGTLYFDYYDEWDLVLSVCDSSEGVGEYNGTWYRCKEDSVEVVELTGENWDTYFEIAGAEKWVDIQGEKNWVGYSHYLYLKPKYADVFTDMGHVVAGHRLPYRLSVQCSIVPYYGEVDTEKGTFEMLERNEEEETEYIQYNLTFEMLKGNLDLYQREDGAAEVIEIDTDDQRIDDGNVIDKYSIDVLEDMNVVEASGILYFAKEYYPEKDSAHTEK